MILAVVAHRFHYELENLCRVFFPLEKITLTKQAERGEELQVNTTLVSGEQTIARAQLYAGDCVFCAELPVPPREDYDAACELTLAQALFAVLREYTGYQPQWGILTGVRPSKLMLRLMRDSSPEEASRYFQDSLLVSTEKTALAQRVAREEEPIIARSRPDSFSLYAAVPFCPSRCSYCSFVSHSITGANAKKLIPDYVKNLARELEQTGRIAAELGLRCESIYIGGGTPTVLDEESLAFIMERICASFNMQTVREFTVEAGRPDTITKEKLKALRRHGVERVSINPQSFSDEVLQRIGRMHKAQETVEAYRLARACGFSVINMDVIAGLPGDSPAGFMQTLERVLELQPENVTVHTLALKRASRMMTQHEMADVAQETAEMLHTAQRMLSGAAFHPYYMYRQSRCVGNLENVGWCIRDSACIYNIYMMEETHTVLAAGAGAVTKLKDPQTDYLERLFNFKFPYEYNSRFAEMLERKERIAQFYQQYGKDNGPI